MAYSMRRVYLVMMAVVMALSLPLVQGMAAASPDASAPAPGPTSDGASIDQAIAYVLMLVALVVTYLIHPLDASSSSSSYDLF